MASALPWRVKAIDLDPIGSITASRFGIGVGVVSLGYAVAMTIETTPQISSWPLAITALVLLVAAYAWLIPRAIGGARPGLSGLDGAIAFGLVLLSAVLCTLSQLGVNQSVRDDWGLLVLGFVLVAFAPLRGPLEVLGYAITATVGAAVLAATSDLTGLGTAAVVPTEVVLLVAIAPTCAIGAGAVAYARTLATGLDAVVRADDSARSVARSEAGRAFVADDVVEQIGALREGALPLLTRIDREGRVTEDDIALADRLARSLTAMLAAPAASDSLSLHVGELVDPDGMLSALDESARAALRSLLVGMAVSEHGARERIRLEIIDDETCVVVASSDDPHALRDDVQPYLRLLKLVLRDVSGGVVDDAVRVTLPVRR